MKRISTFIFALFVSITSFAQKGVSARSIFEAIEKHQQIQYDGVVVTGDLDLTELSNKKRKNSRNIWDEYKSTVEVSVVFRNCTFKGDVIAYKNLSKDGKRQSNAHFKGETSFSGNLFSEYANFKYADFGDQVYFKNARFRDYADFKYAHFHDGVSFKRGRFQRHADFKYTSFSNDTDFQSADFEASTDFKYSNGKRYVSR